MIAVSRRNELVRIALLRGDMLAEFYLWNLAAPDGVGDIYTGRVDAVMPGLAGRFVSLGTGAASGFVPDSAGGKNLSIGSHAAFRVTRAALGGKGPRLEVVPEPPGASLGLLQSGPGPIVELATRLPGQDIVIDDYALMADMRPVLDGRMRFTAQAFDAILEDEVAGLAEPIAALPHGAKLHITPAPAATLLDVDAASASDMPPMTLNNSIIPEICRQILIRNLSGGILIDFAGMKSAAREKLGPALRMALRNDLLNPDFLGFSHLGLAEISRRRIRPPLHEILAP